MSSHNSQQHALGFHRIEIEKCLHESYQNRMKKFKYDKNTIVSPPVIYIMTRPKSYILILFLVDQKKCN